MHDRCPICDRPLATAEDRERGDVDGTVCWWGAIPGACGGERVDWRARCLEAEAEVATLRLALGTLPDAQVLSPLSVRPVDASAGQPAPNGWTSASTPKRARR
jgi:hypothetical protein